MQAIPETGYLRISAIVGDRKAGTPAIIPVSRSTWWAGVRSGRYPQPTRALGSRITAWRVEDIRGRDGRVSKVARYRLVEGAQNGQVQET